jgi:hypothetical protein
VCSASKLGMGCERAATSLRSRGKSRCAIAASSRGCLLGVADDITASISAGDHERLLFVMLYVPFVSSSYNEASAQARETQARSHCGTQRAKGGTSMQTGCWTVGPVKGADTSSNDGEAGITFVRAPTNLAHAGMYAHDSMRKVTRTE